MLTTQAFNSRKLPYLEIIIAQQLVLLPLYFFVPFWIAIVNLSAAGLVLWSTSKTKFILPRWLKVLITTVAIAGVFLVFKKISGKEAGVSLISVMYGLKILETRKIRDVYLILNLGFFILVSGFFFSQKPLMAVYQLIPVTAILFALSRLHQIGDVQELPFKKLLKSLSKTLLLSIPLMALLFVFFPRFSGPLWRMPGGASAVSGVGDSMTPGDVSSLQLFDKIAFRATFENEVPKESSLYWRVIVLDEFDGLSWTRGGTSPIKPESIEHDGQAKYGYSISMEPSKQNYLVTLDRAVSSPPNSMLLKDHVVYSRYRVLDRTRYKMTSIPTLSVDKSSLSQAAKLAFTKLPNEGNESSRAWAVEERNKSKDEMDYLQRVLRHINQSSFYYTLTPPIMDEDTVDSFWLNHKRGFCEHYSSAFVFLARAAGIPARVVIGYQGGEKNPLADYWIVRYANAHAWTEVWLDGSGWVRIDPTAAIAPHRVEQALLSEYSQREGIFDDFDVVDLDDLGYFKQIEYWLDEVNNNWNDWIIDFNSGRQRQLFNRFGFEGLNNRHLIIIMGSGVLFFLLFMSLQKFNQRKNSDALCLAFISLEHFIRNKLNIDSKVSLGPNSLMNQIANSNLDKKEVLEKLVDEYITLRYKSVENSPSESRKLARKVKSELFYRRLFSKK